MSLLIGGFRPWDPPRYEHKSGMIIPRYANTGVLCASGTCLAPTEAERRKDCGSAKHGTIRRHHIDEIHQNSDLRLVDFFVAFFKKNTLDRYRMWVYYQHMNNRSNVCRKRVETWQRKNWNAVRTARFIRIGWIL